MIRVVNVSKKYRLGKTKHVVLDKINFEIPKGMNLGILGFNGAGKSTLIRLLGGVEKPNTGYIQRNARISWPIGFSNCFHRSLSGADNTKFVARIYGADLKEMRDFVEDFSELGRFMHAPVITYSSGMVARLAFALSMAIDFDCYLVDEITAVGDSNFKKKCHEAFLERRNRANVIMVSHSVSTLRNYCDVGAILHNGKLTFYDDLDSAFSVYNTLERKINV